MSSGSLDLSLGDIIKKNDSRRRATRRTRGTRGRGRRGGRGGRRSLTHSYGAYRNGRTTNRRNPYGHLKGLSVEDIALGHAGSRALKVSAKSNPKTVAGAICHCLRIGGVPPALIVKGTTAINQAIKSIAIARSFLEGGDEKADLIAQPAYNEETAECLIHVRRAGPIVIDDASDSLLVTKKTLPHKLAGAICARVRDKERCLLSAIGPVCVMNCVKALAISREFLREERIDIKFIPQFQKVTIDGRGDMSAVVFACLPRRV